MAPRIFAQTPALKISRQRAQPGHVDRLGRRRSLDFYQGLFGMPVQARQGSTVLLRIGNGPRFLALRRAAAGERPSISALGFGVQDFAVDRALKTLSAHGVTEAPCRRAKPGPKQVLVRRGGRMPADRRTAARASCSWPIRAALSSSCTT